MLRGTSRRAGLAPTFLPPTLLGAALLGLAPFLLVGCDAGAPSPPPEERTGEAQQAACDFGASVPGIDVSKYQGVIDWPAVAADGWKFAITRISHGEIDPQFSANWSGIKAAGLVRGAYQYFEPADDPLEQAQIVIDAVGMLGPGDLPVSCDVESPDRVDPATYVAVLTTWMDAVEAGTGKRPMIYTRATYWDPYVNSDAFADSPLWVAHYTNNCPNIPADWPDWTFWQWAEEGTVGGIGGPVDHNYFHGSEADLQALADGGGTYAATLDGVDMSSTVLSGEMFTVSVTFTNSGGEVWDSSTHLGTSEPRDRESDFAAPSWIDPHRPTGVTGTVEPGASYTFSFDLIAPEAPGAYVEDFALVQEGTTWFSDAGGPADDAVHLAIQVVERESGSGGAGSGGDRGDGGSASDDDEDDDGTSHGDGGSGGEAASAAMGDGSDSAGPGASDDAANDDGCSIARPGRGAAGRASVGDGPSAPLALISTVLALALGRRRKKETR